MAPSAFGSSRNSRSRSIRPWDFLVFCSSPRAFWQRPGITPAHRPPRPPAWATEDAARHGRRTRSGYWRR